MVGFNRRFDPSFADVRTRVAAGEIGRLEQLTIVSRDPAPPPAAYLATSGGLFRDMTIHDFDMARYLLGEVVEVTATATTLVADHVREAGDVDTAVVVLQGRDGALCSITNSRRCAFGYDQRLEAFGEHGMLTAANQLPTTVRFSGAEHTEAAAPYLNFFLDRYTPAYRAEMDHFVSCVEKGTTPEPGFADGRAALGAGRRRRREPPDQTDRGDRLLTAAGPVGLRLRPGSPGAAPSSPWPHRRSPRCSAARPARSACRSARTAGTGRPSC
jgi:myo-inositol 2-dehydrogenase / D-chiro-inositol 1-dehydrogenase